MLLALPAAAVSVPAGPVWAAGIAPVSAPSAPRTPAATAGDRQAAVTFTAPVSSGGAPVSSYRVTAADLTQVSRGGQSATSTGAAGTAPRTSATVTGLSDGDSYTFTVTASNSAATSPASAPSNRVIPRAPAPRDPIADKYTALGGARSVLGTPTSGEFAVAGGRGQNFQHGSIFYTPATGAHEVHGLIAAHYRALGGPAGLLGFPVSDELAVRDRVGRVSLFAGADGAAVFFTPRTGGYSLHGAILAHYLKIGGPLGAVGYPLSDERGTTDRVGRFNFFAAGIMFWTPRTGAHEVHGAILGRYARLGYEHSRLGYPVSDEYAVTGGRRSDFAGGAIVYRYATGATTVSYLR